MTRVRRGSTHVPVLVSLLVLLALLTPGVGRVVGQGSDDTATETPGGGFVSCDGGGVRVVGGDGGSDGYGPEDDPYLVGTGNRSDDGGVFVVGTPGVRLEDQTTTGRTVTVATLSNVGCTSAAFLVVTDDDGTVYGVRRIGYRVQQNVTVELDEPLAADGNVTVTLYEDTNENGRFDPRTDRPTTTRNGRVLSDAATVRIGTPTQTATGTATTTSATGSPTEPERGPGLGGRTVVVVLLVGLVVAAVAVLLLRVRRNR